MSSFDDLDPEIRCFALVGQFLQAWGEMESTLHNAIGAALRIEINKLRILCANIEFGNKIYVLRTLVDLSASLPEQDKAVCQKELRELAEYAKLRNMIAHNPFGPDESKKAVQFSVVRARGKFEAPNEIWDESRFSAERDKIKHYRMVLGGIEHWFLSQPLPPQDYARGLYRYLDPTDWWWASGQSPLTIRNTMSSALANFLSRQSPTPPDSHQATHTPDPQKPDELQE